MTFSLFGKKPAKPETPTIRKAEERARAVREQHEAKQAEKSGSGASSSPPEAAVPAEAVTPSVPPLEYLTIPHLPPEGKGFIDSILCIDLDEAGDDIPEPIEEAAVLFANGQAEEALKRLTAALRSEDLSAWQLQMWLMLFDLLQHLGRRDEFDGLALNFAQKLERSPPVWIETSPRVPAGARAVAAANITLTGTLGAQSGPAFEQMRKALLKQPRVRLDFIKVQAVESEGAQLLLDLLQHLRAAKKEVVLVGGEHLLALLKNRAKAGDRSVHQPVWLLLLEIYQQLGLQTEFEDAAVEFAVTYELSPPSFDAGAGKAQTSVGGAGTSDEALDEGGAPDEAFAFPSELAGQKEELFADLVVYASFANPVVIDLKDTRRIDFVNAGRLLNVLEKIKAEGNSIVVHGASQMIIALFTVMGIPRVARIIPRK